MDAASTIRAGTKEYYNIRSYYVIKVHEGYTEPDVISPFDREVKAYRRLTERGVCDRGIIPIIYGVIENIDVKSWRPDLDWYEDHGIPPSAIILEYIPNLEETSWENYNEKRTTNFIEYITHINNALHTLNEDELDTHWQNILNAEAKVVAKKMDFEAGEWKHSVRLYYY
ncbi:hypothetical protein FQN57_001831 [Myotisia sp. PD_48]|nr:hypothetical protein FQN57_001831 [Myotisia sp. PD_48]